MASEKELRDYVRFMDDRLAVVEQLLVGLCRRAGAHEPYIKMWRENVANWPDVKNPLSTDAQYLVDWVRRPN